MSDFAKAEYAIERLKILAEEVVKISAALREKFPEEYEKRERLGMMEHAASVFLESE